MQECCSVEVCKSFNILVAFHKDGAYVVETHSLLSHVLKVLEDVESFVVVEQSLSLVSLADRSRGDLDCFCDFVES